MRSRFIIGATCAVLFILTIVAANWAVDRWGAISVGFGLVAPAGVYAVGVAFILRDVIHHTMGRIVVLPIIFLGAALSYLISPSLALASGAAFLVSELSDFLVFSTMPNLVGVVASNIVGVTVDSIIFLFLAFGSLAFFPGQVVGKLWITAAFIPFAIAIRSLVGHKQHHIGISYHGN